jgi:hypothetical protein
VATFLESPAGLAFLHRLVLAARLVFTQQGCSRANPGSFATRVDFGSRVACELGARARLLTKQPSSTFRISSAYVFTIPSASAE